MEILVIVGILVFLRICAHYSDDPGILGSITNILYYLWRKFWAVILILGIVVFFIDLQ